MAITLFKLAISQSANHYSYFYKTTAALPISAAGTTLSVGKFFTDSGATATAFATSGLPSLQINGVQQQTGIYHLSAGKIVFKISTATNSKTVLINSPITLNVSYAGTIST